MPARLSYSKFASLLKKHGYITSTVYFIKYEHDKRAAVFFECRLPKTQKSILVHIPSRYIMVLPTELTPRTIELVESGGSGILTERSVSYLLNVRGPLIDADLAAISSDGVCHSKFSGKTTCYFFASNVPEKKNEFLDIEESEDDEIHQLEEELNTSRLKLEAKGVAVPIKTKVQPQPKEVGEKVSPTQENQTLENVVLTNEAPENNALDILINEAPESDQQEKIELVFEDTEQPRDEDKPREKIESDTESEGHYVDSEGNVISDSSDNDEDGSMVDSSSEEESTDENIVPPSVPKKEIVSQIKSKQITPERIIPGKAVIPKQVTPKQVDDALRISHRSNHVDIEELDIHLGIIYVTIDINLLHRKLDTYEGDALGIYEQIDDNEKDVQSSRVNEIKNQLDLVAKHLELRIREIQTDEKGMKYQLLRLTALLQDAENLKSKAQIKTSTKGSITTNPEVIEIDRIYNRTRKTVHEMNIALLRQRDEIEDILTNFEESLKELFEL